MDTHYFKQGSIIWIDLDPNLGHEQKGRRPALVVSGTLHNRASNITIVMPVTQTFRNSPMLVKLDERTDTSGYVMVDQARGVDLTMRKTKFIEMIPSDILSDVIHTLTLVLDTEEA